MRVDGTDSSIVQKFQNMAKTELQEGRVRVEKNKILNRLDKKTGERIEQNNIREETLKDALEQVNKAMEMFHTELRFKVHEKSGEMMVKVINSDDGKVIREIPPEKVLDMVAYVKKTLGVVVDKFI